MTLCRQGGGLDAVAAHARLVAEDILLGDREVAATFVAPSPDEEAVRSPLVTLTQSDKGGGKSLALNP